MRTVKYPARMGGPVSRKVFLDANALMMPFQFRINLEAEVRRLLGEADLVVPGPVLGELRNRSKDSREAKSALRLAQSFPIEDAFGTGDDVLVELAERDRGIVVTNDAALLRRLRDRRIPRIYLRSRSHLVLEGD